MENSWSIEIEVPSLEFKGKDSIDEHGSFTLDIPSRPCLHHASLESAMLSALSTLRTITALWSSHIKCLEGWL
jgi:hypothetical protein